MLPALVTYFVLLVAHIVIMAFSQILYLNSSLTPREIGVATWLLTIPKYSFYIGGKTNTSLKSSRLGAVAMASIS